MLQQAALSLSYSHCAQIALGLFLLAFGLVIYATLRLQKTAAHRFASIPLTDRVEDPRDGR